MRSHRLWRALSERRGEGYVDVIVLVLCAVMVLALAMRVLPVFIQKQQLDTFATELVREAEVSGRRPAVHFFLPQNAMLPDQLYARWSGYLPVPLCCQKKQGFIRTFYGPVMEESS